MANERDDMTALSEAGLARRERMRQELLEEVQNIRRARRRRRHALIATTCVALAGSVWLTRFVSQQVPPESLPQMVHSPHKSPEQPVKPQQAEAVRVELVDASVSSRTERIGTDPTILDRYRTAGVPLRHVAYISDEQLVRELAMIGEPASVIRLPDRVLLVRAEPASMIREPSTR